MHRHAELCAGAVDPLEIAAGLEAQGVTDRVAGSFRHRDVFALAEELYARVPSDAASAVVRQPAGAAPGRGAAALYLLPGLLCAAGWLLVPVWGRPAVAVAVPSGLVAVLAVLRRGPLAVRGAGRGTLWACLALGLVLYGEPAIGALTAPQAAARHVMEGLFRAAALADLTGLALALGPAAWCAQRFEGRARAHLTPSRSLEEFVGAVRPLLAGTLCLFVLAQLALLGGTLALAGLPVTPMALVGPAALGVLLFTARLLAVHGYPGVAAAATGTACAVAALASALALAAALHRPAPPRALADSVSNLGPAVIAAVACGCAALVLAAYAIGVLCRASAHTPLDDLEQ